MSDEQKGENRERERESAAMYMLCSIKANSRNEPNELPATIHKNTRFSKSKLCVCVHFLVTFTFIQTIILPSNNTICIWYCFSMCVNVSVCVVESAFRCSIFLTLTLSHFHAYSKP